METLKDRRAYHAAYYKANREATSTELRAIADWMDAQE